MHDGIILITFKFTIVVLSFRQTSEMQGTKFKTSERRSRSISNSDWPTQAHAWLGGVTQFQKDHRLCHGRPGFEMEFSLTDIS